MASLWDTLCLDLQEHILKMARELEAIDDLDMQERAEALEQYGREDDEEELRALYATYGFAIFNGEYYVNYF